MTPDHEKPTQRPQRLTKPKTGRLYKRWRGKQLPPDSKIEGVFYLQLPRCKGLVKRQLCLHTKDRFVAEQEQARICGPLRWSARNDYLAALVELGKWASAQLQDARGIQQSIPIDDAWDRYCESRRRPKSGPHTLASYKAYWETFRAWLPQKARTLADVLPDMANLYAVDMDRSPRSAQTINRHLTFLRLLFGLLQPDRPNPFAGLASNKEAERSSYRALDVEELRAIMKLAEGEMRGLILCGYTTGLRLNDAVHLSWAEYDVRKAMIALKPRKTLRRGARSVVLPVHADFAEWLQSVRPDPANGLVFPGLAARYDAGRDRVSQDVQALFIRAGVVNNELGTASFHSLRHTYDSLLKNSGAPMPVVMRLLGHTSVSTSDGYFHADGDVSRKAVESALPRISR